MVRPGDKETALTWSPRAGIVAVRKTAKARAQSALALMVWLAPRSPSMSTY
jgi:hypothetical protein